ncbi:hypothetical protein [Streptomyces sp. NPDC056144]
MSEGAVHASNARPMCVRCAGHTVAAMEVYATAPEPATATTPVVAKVM